MSQLADSLRRRRVPVAAPRTPPRHTAYRDSVLATLGYGGPRRVTWMRSVVVPAVVIAGIAIAANACWGTRVPDTNLRERTFIVEPHHAGAPVVDDDARRSGQRRTSDQALRAR